MPKNKKKMNVQPATEKTNHGSELPEIDEYPKQVEAEIITPEPQQPKPEPPLTLEALAANQKAFQDALVSDINEVVQRLQPAIQLADQLEQAKQQQQQNPGQQQPAIGGGLLEKILLQTLAGGGGGDDKFKEMVYDSFAKQIAFSQKFQDIFLAKFAGSTISEMTSKVATGQ